MSKVTMCEVRSREKQPRTNPKQKILWSTAKKNGL
jgi:hypothetical protein